MGADVRANVMDQAATAIQNLRAELADRDARLAEAGNANYKFFTDGMQAAAEICGSLAETTYDDADAFEAATGCEAEIMQVVHEQRKEQIGALAKQEPS